MMFMCSCVQSLKSLLSYLIIQRRDFCLVNFESIATACFCETTQILFDVCVCVYSNVIIITKRKK
jgi:hypothetical protein